MLYKVKCMGTDGNLKAFWLIDTGVLLNNFQAFGLTLKQVCHKDQ